MPNHHDKIEEEVKHLVAEFFSRESNRQSLVTVTNIMLSEDEKRAMIYLSVLPQEKEADVLSFAKRKRAEMREYVKKHLRSRAVPFLDVAIDEGEKNRQKIDELLRNS